MPNIHIMTSVKGGVGKTLLTTAIISSYIKRPLAAGKIIGVDLNTMNIDLYKLMTIKPDEIPIPHTQWIVSTFTRHGHRIVRRQVPYSILRGVTGFWSCLSEITSRPEFQEYDLVVDTNLHVANLTQGHPQPDTQINDMLQSCKLYVWIIWTFAALTDPAFVELGIKALQQAANEYESKLCFIHVLNPSALITPQGNFQDVLNTLVEAKDTENKFQQLIERMDDANPDKEELKRMQDRQVLRLMGGIDARQLDIEQPSPFPGLHELMNESPTSIIDYSSFMQRIGNYILKYRDTPLQEIFAYIYEREFRGRGRPRNVLAITKHDPRLRGYTENVGAKRDFNDLLEDIHLIEDDVGRFLMQLL